VTNNGAIWFSGNFAVTNSIAGTGNLTNDAAGTLTLAGTNSYSGATIINGPNFGGLIVANSNALGNTPLVTVISTTGGASGGTRVTLNPGVGTPVGTTLSLPTIGTTVRSALVAAGPSSWNGPITLNGDGTASPGDQIAFIGNAGGLTIGGNVTGVNFPGSLQLRGGTGFINGTINLGTSATLQVNDGVTWTINSIGNTWGLSQLASGVLQLGANNALPTTTTVNFGAAGNGTLDLNGFNQQVAALVIAGGSDLITNSSATADATLTVATNGGASTFSGAIVDGVHKVAVKLAGSTVLTLTASNSYSGNTTISGGKLALSGAGSIGSSATIAVGGGTTLDVSAATPTFTLGASQTLSGTGTNGSIVGSVILNNGALALNYTNGFATLIVTNGVFTLNNNNVTVTVLGTALPAGSYKLVAISPSGSVAGSVGSSIVTVNGAGVAAGALTTLKIAGGELYLVVNHAPVASPLNVSRYAGLSFKLALSDLATNWSDAEGDPISFVSVGSSTNSIAVSTNGGYVLYPNAANVNDQFSYTIVDAQGATATGLVNLLISTNSTGQINSFTATGGTAAMTFAGIPGYAYDVQRSTDLVNWSTILTTNAPANGRFQFVDASAPQPAAYYRLSWNP
jgi:autotransporter-associated beta strand protein